MIVRVQVQIETTPASGPLSSNAYGNMLFSESAQFNDAGFETISKIFTRCHDLLETVKREHGAKTTK